MTLFDSLTVAQMSALRRRAHPLPPVEFSVRSHISWTFSSDASSVPKARHLARLQLADWGLDQQGGVTELLVSELVTNALRHAWGPIRLGLFAQGGSVRCEVADSNPSLPHMSQAGDDDEGGRGLFLLDLLSHEWGSEPASAGKVVWFELSTRAPDD